MSSTPTDKFVNSVYRRLVICRSIEQLGLGMLLAATLATALNMLAIWQSMPTLPILFSTCCLGLLVGIALAFYRWPTRQWAVAEVDRQLGFDDLLTSAMLCDPSVEDDFLNTVRALADTKCSQFSSSDVALWRLSGRAWSGIGLAVSIAITLGVIPFAPVRSDAVDANSTVLSNDPADSLEKSAGNISGQTNNPSSESEWNANSHFEQQTDRVVIGNTEFSPKSSHDAGKNSAGNGGSAVTDEQNYTSKLKNNNAFGTDVMSGQVRATGGGASFGNDAQRSDELLGQQGGTSHPQAQVPGWRGDASAKGGANSKVLSNDQIPARDRDLVRDFFDGH